MTKYKIIIGILVFVIIGLAAYIIYLKPHKPLPLKTFSSLEEHKSYAIKYGEEVSEALSELEFGMSEDEVNETLAIMSRQKNIWKNEGDAFYTYQFDYEVNEDIKLQIVPSFHNNKLYQVRLSFDGYRHSYIDILSHYQLIKSYKLKYGLNGWYGEQEVDDYFNNYTGNYSLSRIDGNRMIEINYYVTDTYDVFFSIEYTHLPISVNAENKSFDDI